MARDLEKWLRERLSEQRYAHSLAVRERAVFLAKRYGEDTEKAAVAGLLHDCCKCLSHDEQLKIIRSRGIILDAFMLAQPQLWHGAAGGIVAEDALGICDMDILCAIRFHSTGAKNMSALEKITYLADLTGTDRKYPDIDAARAMSEQSLDAGMRYCLKHIINMLLESGAPIVRDTWEAYNYFWNLEQEMKQ